MAWVNIPDADIDENSALKTSVVMQRMRDNPEAIHAGTSPALLGLHGATTVGQPRGYIRPDGAGRCEVCPMEVSDIFVIDEDNPAWPIPLGARQLIIECWGGGGANGAVDALGFNIRAGCAGAYCMRLVDVNGFTTLAITIGEGGDVGGAGGATRVLGPGPYTMTAGGGTCYNGAPNDWAIASGGDINCASGNGPAVRGGDVDPDTGFGVMGGAGLAVNDSGQYQGGKGRVIVRVVG